MIEDGKVVDQETIYEYVKGLVVDILEKNNKLTDGELVHYCKLQCNNYGVPEYDLEKAFNKINLEELRS